MNRKNYEIVVAENLSEIFPENGIIDIILEYTILEISVPPHFWFNKEIRLAIPLVAIPQYKSEKNHGKMSFVKQHATDYRRNSKIELYKSIFYDQNEIIISDEKKEKLYRNPWVRVFLKDLCRAQIREIKKLLSIPFPKKKLINFTTADDFALMKRPAIYVEPVKFLDFEKKTRKVEKDNPLFDFISEGGIVELIKEFAEFSFEEYLKLTVEIMIKRRYS